MDFGVVGCFDSLLCPNSSSSDSALDNNNNNNHNGSCNKQQKWGGSGSGFLKQEMMIRAINEEEDELRDQFKVAKTYAVSNSSSLLQRCSNGSSVTDGHQQQMLSFSSPNSQTIAFPCYRNSGYGSTGMNAATASMLSGFRGPFTPSQWMELDHQALIYKYIAANVPIPSYLLNPIRRAFESAGFSAFPGLRSNALGWGAFHLGFSSTDPEPGRCRRTDGKKWRCSRDAVADQKYCERHMNRGRHRSRKPVEGQLGHSATASTTTTTAAAANTSKLTPMAAASSTVPAGGVSSSLHQLTNHLQPSCNRSLPSKENVNAPHQHTPVLSMKGGGSAYEESSRPEFGLVCSDSLLNPLNKSSSLVNDNSKPQLQNSLRQFINAQPDRTQLSISIPMATSDYLSSTSSPTREKLTSSPLIPSHELEMGLGVGTTTAEQRQATNWVPISWEPTMGGPLGEVLHTTTECRNTKPLNLIDSWDNSPQLPSSSSPTGVLQRGAFGSLSNSSAGSSPSRTTLDGASLCNGLISPGLMNPYLPAI